MNARQRRNRKIKNFNNYISNYVGSTLEETMNILLGEDKEPTIEEIKEVWSNTPKEVTTIFADTASVMSDKYYQLLFDKTELIKFDENTTDEDIDNFFDKL